MTKTERLRIARNINACMRAYINLQIPDVRAAATDPDGRARGALLSARVDLNRLIDATERPR